MIKQENYIGKTYGKLTILSFTKPKIYINKYNKEIKIPKVLCNCSCGSVWECNLGSLKSGITKSCGCYKKEKFKLRNNNESHGLTKNNKTTPEYKSWINMKTRCLNPKFTHYKEYGGRGITICKEWLKPKGQGFLNFLKDMGKRPSKLHTINRINNDGNYEPSNCKWATKKEQANNRRNTIFFTYKEKIKTLSEWCDELNLNYYAILGRVTRYNWSIEKAFETPIRFRYKN